ncbi:MAG: hypothetical protein QM503_01055 [Bacteroidota bacterium]
MKLKVTSFLFISLLILSSCNNLPEKQVILSQPVSTYFDNLSSASGIGINEHTIYIVGDDTPWLFQLDNNLTIINKTQISSLDTLVKGRTPKHLKSDFEGAEVIKYDNKIELVVISSGSSKITRDTAYIIDLIDNRVIFSKNLRALYENIKLEAKLPSTNEINIEGIAFSNEHAYLMHRGNVSTNIIIKINRDNFLNYIKNSDVIPDFDIYKYKLPKYNGVQSGFSGVCLNPDNSGLIFTASMEDTKDEINDGSILGSYVGIIPFSEMSNGEYTASLLLDNNKLLEKKLEGISVNYVTESGELQVVAVCDNDNGTSDIITFRLIIK